MRKSGQRPNAELRAALADLHHEHEGRCVHCVEWCDCLDRNPNATFADCTHGNVAWPCPTARLLAA